MKIAYSTKATATGGRDGVSVTDDGRLNVLLAIPKELGGPGGEGTNPEQLFAAGYSACFIGTMKFVAGKRKIRLPDDTTVTATVGVGPRDDGNGFGLDVELAVHIPGLSQEEAREIIDGAHIVCPYSEATRNNLDVRLIVV